MFVRVRVDLVRLDCLLFVVCYCAVVCCSCFVDLFVAVCFSVGLSLFVAMSGCGVFRVSVVSCVCFVCVVLCCLLSLLFSVLCYVVWSSCVCVCFVLCSFCCC